MSLVTVRALLEQRLATVSPNLSTAYENVPFTPTAGTPWQAVTLMPAMETTRSMDPRQKQERGIFQVLLSYPEKVGPGAASAKADAIAAQFARGLTLQSGGITIRILQAPHFGVGKLEGGWYRLPVSIRYQSEIMS